MQTERSTPKRAAANEVWRLIGDCAMAQFGRASALMQREGLNPGHGKLLIKLGEDGDRTMGALAQSFRCDASTMTWLVDRLEERGLVERRVLPADRRAKAVVLTPAGVRLREQVLQLMYEPPEELLTLDRTALEHLKAVLLEIRDSVGSTQVDAPSGDAAVRPAGVRRVRERETVPVAHPGARR